MVDIVGKVSGLFRRDKGQPRRPDLRAIARTGDGRYVPQINVWEQRKDGRVVIASSRFDHVTLNDYDRVRWYPVVRDALNLIESAVSRANFHFACPREEIAELASQELRDQVRPLLTALIHGALAFGRQSMEKVWRPKFDVTVSSGQASAEGGGERFYPYIWTIDRYASLDPQDTRILISTYTGRMWGVRSFIPKINRTQDIPCSKLVHYVYNREFDSNYGIPRTKAAVPFVELVESVWDDMAGYSKVFGQPLKVGRHPDGSMNISTNADGTTAEVTNAQFMVDTLQALNAGDSVSIPSEPHRDTTGMSSIPKWDIELLQPPAEDRYVDKINLLHQTIRMAVCLPELASSSTPEAGTYNLGEAQIDQFLDSIERELEQLSLVVTESVCRDFVTFNFGASAPDMRLVIEPLDAGAKRALLAALLALVTSGMPFEGAKGEQYDVDWPMVAQEFGVPIVKKKLKNVLDHIRDELSKRLAAPDEPAQPEGNQQPNDQPNTN